MVVSCPSCSTRLRMDRKRLGGKKVTLRCARCREVFQVAVPSSGLPAPRLRVVVAHSDPALCAAVDEILSGNGIVCRICHDGAEALASMEAEPPQVAVVDVALPELYAFEVVEKVRSRPGLEEVKIILLSSVYNKMAYKRTPSSLYGADDYIEKHHIPDDLLPKIHRLVSKAQPSPTVSEVQGEVAVGRALANPSTDGGMRSFVEEVNAKLLRAEEEAGDGDDVARAARLARIIVTDIALYSQDRLEAGIRAGNVFEVLAPELEEGRRLFAARVAPELCHRNDFIHQAFSALVERRGRELRGEGAG